MKATLIGFSRSTGISHKSGSAKPFDIPRLHVLEPISSYEKENFKRFAGGFAMAEVACHPEVIAKLNGSKFPREVDLVTESELAFGTLRTTVTDIKA